MDMPKKIFFWFALGVFSLSVSVAPVAAAVTSASDPLALPRAVWQDHYRSLLEQGKVRPFNEPRLFDHGRRTAQVVVLIHGLSDSPYFIGEIGKVFYQKGFNVLIPLLPGHGLKQPADQSGFTYQDWVREVDFALQAAAMMGDTISIGGLSTGGALAVYAALSKPTQIKGALLLFSTALSLGSWHEGLMRSSLFDRGFTAWVSWRNRWIYGELIDGIGANPYRYSHMYYLQARELVLLNDAIRSRYTDAEHRYADLVQPVFIGHSAADATARIGEIEKIVANHRDAVHEVTYFRIAAALQVQHASLVLKDDVTIMKGSEPLVLEKKNPLFDDMMSAMTQFLAKHLSVSP